MVGIPKLKRTTVAVIVVVVVLASALMVYLWDKNGGSLDFSDTQRLIVISSSMDGEPRTEYEIETIPVGSMVFVTEVPDGASERESFYESLRVGDILTFNYTHPISHERMVVTHRIVEISSSGGSYTYTMAGDSIVDDPTNSSVQIVTSDSGDIIGKVTGVSVWLGYLATFMSEWYGKVLIVLIPCAIIIASEAGNIVRVLRGGKADQAGPDDASEEGADGRS